MAWSAEDGGTEAESPPSSMSRLIMSGAIYRGGKVWWEEDKE